MEKVNFLPLGSVVLLEGGIRKVLIISRGIRNKEGEEEVIYDYAGVIYPVCLVGDQMAYFNHNSIEQVVFEGYRDAEDETIVRGLNKYLAEHPELNRHKFDENE